MFVATCGQVNQDAFFTLLSLNNIILSDAAKNAIVKQCACASRGGPTNHSSGLREIKYPTAIIMMCVDMSLDDPFNSPWIARTGEKLEESNKNVLIHFYQMKYLLMIMHQLNKNGRCLSFRLTLLD